MIDHQPQHSSPPASASNRSFGVVFTVFFGIIGLLPLLGAHSVRVWALVLSGVFMVLTLVAPGYLAPLNRLWARFGALLHRIVSPIALAVLFFLVVTPIALLMRILGKDPLRMRLDPQAQSYWIVRDPPGPKSDSLKDQF
jgi:hypothetical protein